MAEKSIAGKTIGVDDNGYLTDPTQWTPEIAAELAAEVGISTLTDKHFAVIDYLRKSQADGVQLSLRKVGKSGIVNTKEFYDLFPGGPLKVSSLIAGIPKPVSCV